MNELASNTRGGARRRTDYADQIEGGVTLNLERLMNLHDALFQITFTERTGRNLVTDAELNTLQLVQEVYGRGQTARLTQFWFNQKYLNGFVDWKVGRMGVGDDFAAFACDFQNLTFCGSNPGNIVGYYIYNWPISQWATRVKLNFDSSFYFQMGAYDQNRQYLGYQQALLPVFFRNSTGVLMPAEFGWVPGFAEGRLPGSYKIGAWYSTTVANDVILDINGNLAALTGLPPLQDRGLYGAYINFKQQLTPSSTRNSSDGLSAFLNAVIADRQTATTDRQIAAGLTYTGLFSWRPKDDISFAAGTTHVNSRLAGVETLLNALGRGPVGVQRSEYVFESFYTFVASEGLLLRPNIQYIVTPGGTGLNKNVVVFGLKTKASF